MKKSRYRMLALDVDGTLLDASGELRATTIDAITRAAQAGIRPVLCTGRRYRRALPIAEQLGVDAPLVCNSGAVIKDPATHETIWRADLDSSTVEQVFKFFQRERLPAISFTDRTLLEADVLVSKFPTGTWLFDEYVELNREHAEISDFLTDCGESPEGHFHVCAIGSREEMLVVEDHMHQGLKAKLRTFVQKSPRYSGTMCEVLSPEASKWSALLHLASLWGIDHSEICAVGDDVNDVPMIEGAGLGVAMGHAPASVLAVADHVTSDHHHDGVARLMDEVLLRSL